MKHGVFCPNACNSYFVKTFTHTTRCSQWRANPTRDWDLYCDFKTHVV